jgi:hypothetical protein
VRGALFGTFGAPGALATAGGGLLLAAVLALAIGDTRTVTARQTPVEDRTGPGARPDPIRERRS